MLQFPRVDRVVFDRVAGPDHLGILQAPESRRPCRLHVDRHAGRHPVHVDLVRIEAFRLQENLVPALVRKFDDLVFDRRTIARAQRLQSDRYKAAIGRCSRSESGGFRRLCTRDGRGSVLALFALVRNENGVGTASPGCGSNRDQSMVRPSSRGGVPVFSRVHPARACEADRPAGSRALRRSGRRCTSVRRRAPGRSGRFRW